MLHTGDFKMDQLPLDGRLTDLAGVSRLGEEGLDLVLVDSTNAEVPGFVASEREILPALERAFATAERRLIVASFASHVHRIQQVLDCAVKYRRKVAFVGRSMVRNMGIARDLGYLQGARAAWSIDAKQIEELPPDQVVLVCTGSQGEPMAALSRMASRDHQIRIVENDTVVLASSLIPGNESSVYRVINGLGRWGANVVHKGNAKVHVSGHASAGELLYFYNSGQAEERDAGARRMAPPARQRRPRRAHGRAEGADRARRGRRGGRPGRRRGQDRRQGPCGYVYVDGASVGDITEASLKDRRILGDEGFISVFAVVDSDTGKVVGGPQIQSRGSGIDDDAVRRRPSRRSRRRWRTPRPTASATPTSCSRSSAGSSASGCTTPTAVAR